MRIVVADGDPAVRAALCGLATQSLDARVVGDVAGAPALQREVEVLQPDLLIVAWRLIAPAADAVLAALRNVAPGLHIVVLGPRPDLREPALRAGADGFISNVDQPDVVLRVLRSHIAQQSNPSTEPGGTA